MKKWWYISLLIVMLFTLVYSLYGAQFIIRGIYERRTAHIDEYSTSVKDTTFLHNDVKVFTKAKDKFQSLFEDIRQAKDQIHLEYYKIGDDKSGKEFIQILTQKAAQGVDVKVIVDGIVNFKQDKRMFDELIAAGGEVREWRDQPLHVNFRLHRKIAIIDSKIAYTGGMNVGNKYLGTNPKKSPWRDTHIRFEGDGVSYMEYYFLKDWESISREKDFTYKEFKSYFPIYEKQGETKLSFFYSGVTKGKDALRNEYMKQIKEAKKSLVFQTPYIILDKELLSVIKEKAKEGIRVVFMIPANSPDRLLRNVTAHNMDYLIEENVKFYLYDGYMHAKSVFIDEEIALIGSANMDVRSMSLNEEMFVEIEDGGFSAQYRDVMKEDFKRCKELNVERFEDRGWKQKMLEYISAWLTPIL